MPQTVAPAVLHLRIRNRIIEYLELASSFDAQPAYQAAVPAISVPNEIINQWEDWVSDRSLDKFSEPVFSPAEQAAIRKFRAVWDSVAKDTPDPLPPLSELSASTPWERLRRAAEEALRVFQRRGPFDEDTGQFA